MTDTITNSIALLARLHEIELAVDDPSALSDLWVKVNTDEMLTEPERAIALGRIQRYLDGHVKTAVEASPRFTR